VKQRAFNPVRCVTAAAALAGSARRTAIGTALSRSHQLLNVATNVRTATALGEHRAMRDRERDELARKYALPRTKAAVGDATIDVFGAEQGFAFLNDLNWHPRPVFQAYSVFTDSLSRDNARFLESANARFAFRSGAIDGRLRDVEAIRARCTHAARLQAVLGERGCVLFERRADAPRRDERPIVLERELMAGDARSVRARGACSSRARSAPGCRSRARPARRATSRSKPTTARADGSRRSFDAARRRDRGRSRTGGLGALSSMTSASPRTTHVQSSRRWLERAAPSCAAPTRWYHPGRAPARLRWSCSTRRPRARGDAARTRPCAAS
jgi:hypothetical protein